jgi:hypothetical protein
MNDTAKAPGVLVLGAVEVVLAQRAVRPPP